MAGTWDFVISVIVILAIILIAWAKVSDMTIPELLGALRDFLLAESPEVVVFFHSANDGVYPNFCDAGPSREVLELTDLYSKASGYPFYDKFTNYEVTGAAESWLATQGISAITVELSTHKVIEFEKNLAGIKAMLGFYSETR